MQRKSSVSFELLETRRLLAVAPFTPVTYLAKQTTAPIVVDGRLDEAAWVSADNVTNFFLYGGNGAAAPEATSTRILWDANNVYVGMTITDVDVDSAGVGHDGPIFNGDNAELFLKPALGDTPYYEWEFSPNGDVFDARFPTRGAQNPPPTNYESGLTKAIHLNGTDGNDADPDTGWTLEFSIPRSAMTAFTAGDTWTFLAARYDYPKTGQPVLMLSSPGDTSSGFHTYEIYNNLKFVASAVTNPAPFQIGGDPSVNPADFRVTTFATLNHPYGMQQLSDGSLLVGISTGDYFSAPGQLIRLVDANGDGTADGPGTVLADNLPARLTSIRQAGDLVFVSGPAGITVLRKGTSESDPYTSGGTLSMAFPTGWEHTHYAVEVRPTPGQAGSTDLFFNVGSLANDSTTASNLTVPLSGLVSGNLLGDSIYKVTVEDTGNAVSVSGLQQIASGLRNAAGFAFDSATGDLYFEDNGIDGSGPFGDEPVSADELNVIRAADIGGAVENFGFATDYIAYRGARTGSGGVQPVVAFQPLPSTTAPSLGSQSEGPAEIALSPQGFPAALRNGIFTGFYGKFAAGAENEENAVVFYNRQTGDYFHFIENSLPGIGHLTGLLTTQDSLFLADLTPTNNFGPGGGGAIYQIKSLAAGNPPGQPTLDAADTSIIEGQNGTTNAVFTLTLSSPSNDPITVQYATADGTATAGSDYEAATGVITFAPGETSNTVDVAVVGDTSQESAQAFSLVLSSATNATLGRATAVGTILNDDVASKPPLQVKFAGKRKGAPGKAYSFSMTYFAPRAIDPTTLGGDEILITDGNGQSFTATLTSTKFKAKQHKAVAKYKVVLPQTATGTSNIVLQSGSVSDIDGGTTTETIVGQVEMKIRRR